MKNKSLLMLLALALAAGLCVVGSVVWAANRTQPAVSDNAVSQQQNQKNQQDNTVDPQDNNISEAQESQQLASQAKISADEAKKIAEAKVGGTASDATLGDEDGTIVYEVTIGNQDVKVNALDGSVLKVEKSDGEVQDDQAPQQDKEINDDNNKQSDAETNDDTVSQQ